VIRSGNGENSPPDPKFITVRANVSELLCDFYSAGYDGRRYPMALNRISVAVRRPVRRAYREGKAEHAKIRRMSRVLRGVYGPLDAETAQMFRKLYPPTRYPQFYGR
jgi:hypothetical protein